MDNIIEVRDVTFKYSTEDPDSETALQNVSLSIKRGSFTVILGHNGSGKSTLAKLMNGLNKPISGSVFVDGMDTIDEHYEFEIKRRVGMVFQNPDNQIIATIVEEDVAFGPENLGIEPSEIRKRVDKALKAVGMYSYKDHPPHKLSGGQKQRVAIAGVIAMEPECIVFDESTAMLDPKGRKEVLDTILELNKTKGITVVLITHFMEEAEHADRIIIMDEGKICADGPPKEIFSNTSVIKQVGLSLPQTTELLYELNNEKYHINLGVISIEECVNAIAELIGREAKL